MSNDNQTPKPVVGIPTITIFARTPEQFPVQITFGAETVSDLLSNGRIITKKMAAIKWTPEETAPGTVQAAPGSGPPPDAPTFAGYACNPDQLDANGVPKFIFAHDGRIAHQREEQGDMWYSIDTGETYTHQKTGEIKKKYDRLLEFKKGEPRPQIVYPDKK